MRDSSKSFIIRIRHSLDQYTPVAKRNAPITGRQQHATWKGPCYHFRRLLCYVTSLESWRIHPSVFLHVAMSLYDINILYGECATDKTFCAIFPQIYITLFLTTLQCLGSYGCTIVLYVLMLMWSLIYANAGGVERN